MKRVKTLGATLLVIAIGTGIYAFSTGIDVPQKVKYAFAKKFPKAKRVKWAKESDTEWEAEFKLKGTEYSANFLEDGSWQETEREINIKTIPVNIKNTLESEFSAYQIEEAAISETLNGSMYEFELEKREEELEVVIGMNGKVIKNEISKEQAKKGNGQ